MQDEIDLLRVQTWKDWVYTAKLDRIVRSYSINLEILFEGYRTMNHFLKNSMDQLKYIYKFKFNSGADPVQKMNYEDKFYKFCHESNTHLNRFSTVEAKLNIPEIRDIIKEYNEMR
jgi:hypothetical protein